MANEKTEFCKSCTLVNFTLKLPISVAQNQYGYFHYLQGLTLAQEHPAKVEPLMKKALEYGLNMKHDDRAMATLNIAAAALSKGRKQKLKNY